MANKCISKFIKIEKDGVMRTRFERIDIYGKRETHGNTEGIGIS